MEDTFLKNCFFLSLIKDKFVANHFHYFLITFIKIYFILPNSFFLDLILPALNDKAIFVCFNLDEKLWS